MLTELMPTLQLEILNLGLHENGPEWRYRQVNSPYSRIFLVLEGQAEVRHHGRIFQLRPGVLTLVSAFTTADYRCPRRFCFYYAHFTSRLTGGVDLFSLGEAEFQVPVRGGESGLFSRLLELLPDRDIAVCRPHDPDQKNLPDRPPPHGSDPGSWLEADGLFRQLLAPLAASIRRTQPIPPRITRVLEYLDEHLEQPVELETLAGLCSLHPHYFSGLFKQTMGMRPVDYLNRRRIERAQSLLSSGHRSIKEVALATGFSDPAYFSRMFLRYTGATPSAYVRNGRHEPRA